MRILLSTLLLLSLLLFNNCSSAKWESESGSLKLSPSDQNSSSNNSDRQPQVSSQCQVSQSSASSMTYGQSLYLNAQYSADLSQPQYDCQNASNWQNLVLVSGVSSYSITGLPVGNHTCRIRYLNLNHQWVYCSGVLGVSVIASQMLPSQPTPNPAPVPNPNPNPVASPIGGKGLYRTDENLPDAISTFTALRASQNYLSNYHVVAETGMSGLRFPSSAWNVMGPSDTIRLAVLVPPGVSSVSWATEFNSKSQLFGSCAEGGTDCHDQSYSPRLWPISKGQPEFDPAFDPMTAPATTVPRIVFLTIKSTGKEGWLMSLTVTYVVQNPEMYERWRSARKWAGGSGDCDGLGNRYLTGSSCQNQNW